MAEPAPPDQLGGMDEGHAAAEGVEAPADPTPSGPSGVIGVLLHTEPALSVSETERELGVSKGAAHLVVAAKKALDALIDGTTGSGTTVAEHVAAGVFSIATAASGDEPEPEQDNDPAPVPVDGGEHAG